MYGVDSKVFSDEKSVIHQMSSQIFETNISSIVYFLLVKTFPFIRKIYKMPFISKRVESFFVQLMDEAIKLREEQKIERDDYLNFLLVLKKKKNLPSIDMAAHTMTFLMDGLETSSNVIAHVIIYCWNTQYPIVQAVMMYVSRRCTIWQQINRFRTD